MEYKVCRETPLGQKETSGAHRERSRTVAMEELIKQREATSRGLPLCFVRKKRARSVHVSPVIIPFRAAARQRPHLSLWLLFGPSFRASRPRVLRFPGQSRTVSESQQLKQKDHRYVLCVFFEHRRPSLSLRYQNRRGDAIPCKRVLQLLRARYWM